MSSVEHFVLRHNIERYERALLVEPDPGQRRILAELLTQARLDLAVIDQNSTDGPLKPSQRSDDKGTA